MIEGLKRFAQMLLRAATMPALIMAGGCTTIVVGKKASAYGKVLIGHNEDNQGEISALNIVPRLKHSKDQRIILNGGGEVEQVGTTFYYLWSEIPGQTFCDFYLNDWGVVVTSNSATSKEKDIEGLRQIGRIKNGGIDYWLRRLIAERAKSAKEGLNIAIELIDRFGYTDTGRMYTIADDEEAWILHVTAGRTYCARRLPDDQVAVIPNSFILEEIDFNDKENYLYSSDIHEYAMERGWYRPGSEGFAFNRVFGAEGEGIHSRTGYDFRQWVGQGLVTGKVPGKAVLPFSVKPKKLMTVEDMKRILRSHYDEMPEECIGSDPPHHGRDRCICYHDTKESLIVQKLKEESGKTSAILWKALGRPCGAVYVPFYSGITEVPVGFSFLPYDQALQQHFAGQSYWLEKGRNPWQTFSQLQEALENKDSAYRNDFNRELWQYEEEQAALSSGQAQDVGLLNRWSAAAAENAWKWAEVMLKQLGGSTE